MRVLVAGMLLAVVTLSALPAQSQELSAEDKYLRRLKVNDAIDPTGTSLFGEQVNLYTGDLTFRHTDVVLEGTGPTISLTRELASVQTSEARMRPHSMGDWVLAIPRIETLTQGPLGSGPVTNPGQQWIVAPLSSADATKRCTLFNRPLYTGGLDDPEDAWNGMDLVTESGERQSLLRRVASSPSAPTVQNGGSAIVFKALTLGNWHIGCLANTSNGEDGEAFIAVAPDGTKYWLNYLTGERAYTVFEQKDGANFRQFRMFANMYASRVEDRFGNFVTYSYTGDQLTAITASDGRAVSLSWRTDAPVISQITVNPGTADQRVWQYQYNVASAEVVTLTGVVLPDGTSWQFNLAGVGGRAATHPDLHKCGLRTLSATGGGSSSTIAHPSGATGTFVLGSRWHSRSYVPTTCLYPNGLASPGVEGIQTVFGGNSLLSKTISGPGLTPSTWSYAYSVAAGSSTSDACAASSTCVDTRWVDVTGPAGDRTRYTYSNRWGAHEGKLLKTETFQGASTLLRTETSTYAAATEGPYPAKVGEVLALQKSNFTKQETWTPLKTAVTAQQGVTFSRATTTFDTLSRPLTNTLSSSLGYSKTESTAYSDFPSLGVLGAVREQKVDGTVTFSTTFTAKAQPWVVSNFGSVVQTLTYQADGNLATAKDALNNVTTLSNWKRGVPQNVTFADNSYLTAEVNNNGWLKWVEDEARSRTCYTFDAMGRLTSITYTSESATNTCNTSTWAATTQSFAPSAIGRYGLPAGYWIQYVDTGKGRTVRHFDALWRPVLEEQFDNTDNPTALATRSMVVKRYDAEGQLEFQSYPVASLTTIGDASLKGVWSEYDALGRIKSSTQDSELGLLPTVTEYLTGFKVKVTSPKLQSTTTSFMAFDAPTQDWPVLMEHPESAFTHITRDKYGKPTKIRRSNNVSPTGGTLAVDRSYTYNAKQELCASTEPETGTTLMGYDAAGNLSWSAAGLPAGTACDATGTTSAVVLRKAARTYDARNRLSTLTFPDGLGNQVWTYLPTGKPGVLTAYNAANYGEPVVTTYSYNRRGLLYHERLVTSLLDWPYEYKYNANGHLASNNWHGIVVAYAPNQLGQPTQAGSYASNVQYFPNGAVKQFTYGNGIVHTLTQNARQLPARSVDGAMLDLSYAYDKNANVASITDATAGARQSRTMTYDNLDRLLTASGPSFGAATYGYDVLDNLSGVKDRWHAPARPQLPLRPGQPPGQRDASARQRHGHRPELRPSGQRVQQERRGAQIRLRQPPARGGRQGQLPVRRPRPARARHHQRRGRAQPVPDERAAGLLHRLTHGQGPRAHLPGR
ncbi:RHS repeat domain-containing protein [Pseudoxanthomonas indica]|uniref:Uncharacterized conserved protein RhaS, contains 28 RHS repeats n=1 Tax=Pseudoxanthomonas indica TaxID=428993 RepID=A0A1T5LZ18_9GAMM|nr:RHS repeat protein [Pseudoxanthomonas indica]GGD42541.1 hypothetical protein GCM10007235_13150 [Pseudoxanthomonas indica]SKC81064.1 Uncharacterized conserved protein RhaS, contains 28 RHS repeats [Pseudoxanthomonas indica]